MTARRLVGALGILLAGAGAAAGQPAVPPGAVTTPGTVFVPAGPATGGQPVVQSGGAGPQMPARDVGGPGAPAGTGVIRGRITEAETGRPLRRAAIQVTGRMQVRDARATSTNDEGYFEVRELPAGDYMLSVRKPGYVSTGYGVKSSWDTPRPIKLADKEVFDKADIALERGGVITGRVVDDYGEPVLEASVRVMRRRWMQGKPQLVPMGNGGQTNDVGEYRVFGLGPGDYYVTAGLRGDFSRGDSDDQVGYATSYYPGTVDAGAAQTVRVTVGGQTQADIALQPVKLGRILGLLLDAAGRPAATGRVMGFRSDDNGSPFLFADGTVSGSVKPDGTFTINAVQPGRYALQGMPGATFAFGSGVVEAADATVDVTPGEISTVTMTVNKGATIRGRVIVEGTPLESLTALTVSASAATPGISLSGARPATVNADGTFELVGARGMVNLRLAGVAPGIVLKAIRVGATDVTLDGVNAPSGKTLANVELHVTKDVSEVAGTVSNAKGELLKNYTVVVFHDDQRRWFSAAGRGYMLARPDQDGRFAASGFLAGTYLAVALAEFDAATFGDPAVMDSLRAMATEITLGDGEKRALDLRLAAQ